MLKSELNEIVLKISQAHNLPMDHVKKTIEAYHNHINEKVDLDIHLDAGPIFSGIIQMDNEIRINPGITIIYGGESCGKTSVAKRVAVAANRQGFNVAYYDAENKMYLHDLTDMEGVVFSNTYRDSGLKKLVNAKLIDAIVIDTITAVNESAHNSFVTELRKKVPYVILVSQTRSYIGEYKQQPALDRRIIGLSHTMIFIDEKEQIAIESEEVCRIQCKIIKYEADREKERLRFSAVISNNIIDNAYSSYDILKASGLVRIAGQSKIVDGTAIGKVKDIVDKPEVISLLIRKSLETYGMEAIDAGIYL